MHYEANNFADSGTAKLFKQKKKQNMCLQERESISSPDSIDQTDYDMNFGSMQRPHPAAMMLPQNQLSLQQAVWPAFPCKCTHEHFLNVKMPQLLHKKQIAI